MFCNRMVRVFLLRYFVLISIVFFFFTIFLILKRQENLIEKLEHQKIMKAVEQHQSSSSGNSRRHRHRAPHHYHHHDLHRYKTQKKVLIPPILARVLMRNSIVSRRYISPFYPDVLPGNEFLLTRRYSKILRELNLLDANKNDEDKRTQNKQNSVSEKPLQFVMPVSKERFAEGLSAIHSMQMAFPNRTLVVFDIGLEPQQANYLRTLCNVKYRKFAFELYPNHVKNLRKFYWKPLVFQTAVRDYSNIFWMETSTHLLATRSTRLELTRAVATARRLHGLLLLAGRHLYSTFSVTDPRMYKWIPSHMARLKLAGQLQTAPLIWLDNSLLRRKISQWMVVCALTPQCLAPPASSRHCSAKLLRRMRREWMRCHRYDQSLLNILLRNTFNFHDQMFFTRRSHKIARLKRGPLSPPNLKPKICVKTSASKKSG